VAAAVGTSKVTVSPEEFALVLFDAGQIVSIAGELAARLGVDRAIHIEVDERTPLGSSAVTSLDPITITVESGAFEDAKRLRHLSRESVEAVVGRHLMRAGDRLDPAFGDPPADDEIPIGPYTTWDVYAVARLDRLGYPSQRPRRQYHFRIRHGFTDASEPGVQPALGGRRAHVGRRGCGLRGGGSVPPCGPRQGPGQGRPRQNLRRPA